MANTDQIMRLRARLQSIEDFAIACGEKLVKFPDADNDWILSRADHFDYLVDLLRDTAKEITR